MLHRRELILGTSAFALTGRAAAQARAPWSPESRHLTVPDPIETIDLWSNGAPDAPAALPTETVKERSANPAYNDRYVFGIARPRMAVFRPERPNGAAALLMPGGGYRLVVIDKEGYEMARWLSSHGVTAFVLFYRLPHEGWASGPDTPLIDAQRAIRLIRHRAASYGIDPQKVIAMGFSAGGHVCASLMTRFSAPVYRPIDELDARSARPDAAAPIYPVISMSLPTAHAGSRAQLIGEQASPELERRYNPALNVPADAPPAFLLHAEDDVTVPAANTLMLREALLAKGIPVETHLYPNGGHGFGLRLANGHSVEGWEAIFHSWCRKRRIF